MQESTKKKKETDLPKKDRSAKKRRYVGLQRFGIVNQRVDVITLILDAVIKVCQQLTVYVVVEEQILQLDGQGVHQTCCFDERVEVAAALCLTEFGDVLRDKRNDGLGVRHFAVCQCVRTHALQEILVVLGDVKDVSHLKSVFQLEAHNVHDAVDFADGRCAQLPGGGS